MLTLVINLLQEVKPGCIYRAYNNIICTDDKKVIIDPDVQKRLVNLRLYILNDG